jgi:hypothetical protein
MDKYIQAPLPGLPGLRPPAQIAGATEGDWAAARPGDTGHQIDGQRVVGFVYGHRAAISGEHLVSGEARLLPATLSPENLREQFINHGPLLGKNAASDPLTALGIEANENAVAANAETGVARQVSFELLEISFFPLQSF